MTISLGVQVGQQDMAMLDMRALWRRLDNHKVDWISVWDHFYEAPNKGGTQPHFEALTTLGALAAETKHARIGCLVMYVGYRNPALLAKAATTLDHLSDGRFELGLGAGWHIWEASAHGYAFPDIGTRLDMLDEAAQIVQSMLSQDRTTFSGTHFQVDNVSCLPKPVQDHLPIWIGGVGEKRTLKIVAERADGWNAAYLSASEYKRLNGVLDQWCERSDRDPKTLKRGINLAFNVSVDDKGLALQDQTLQDDWGKAYERIKSGALLCKPNQVFDEVMTYVEAGAQEINISLRSPWDDEALESYLTEILPKIRSACGG
jgi:alkanesulfonate monooxygenase SsuD/methylene tetrahydromethanopterin reductase-like flavin-dependent oxidoreductase (luciferase family)